jgi:hypothetical protein
MRVGAVLLRAYRAPKVEKVSMTYAIVALVERQVSAPERATLRSAVPPPKR